MYGINHASPSRWRSRGSPDRTLIVRPLEGCHPTIEFEVNRLARLDLIGELPQELGGVAEVGGDFDSDLGD